MSHDLLLSLAAADWRFCRLSVSRGRWNQFIRQCCEVDPNRSTGQPREGLLELLSAFGAFAILLRLSICFSKGNDQPIWRGNCYCLGTAGKIRSHISNFSKGLLPKRGDRLRIEEGFQRLVDSAVEVGISPISDVFF